MSRNLQIPIQNKSQSNNNMLRSKNRIEYSCVVRMNRSPIITRSRLIRRLTRDLRHGHILMTAPPGYGKTVALHSLAAALPETYYLDLTLPDNDLNVLKSHLPSGVSPQSILILDDVHLLQDSSEAWGWIIEQLQQLTPRWIISARSVPDNLQYSTIRWSHHYKENDLAFTLEESKALMQDAETGSLWYSRTKGWPLALSLLAKQSGSVDQRWDLSQKELVDYLARMLISQLPYDVVHFIETTSVPLRFNDRLASILLNMTAEQVARARENILQRNLFIEEVGEGQWKYHDLIRDFLLARISEEDRRHLYQTCADWFMAEGDRPMAIEHMLAGQLFEKAAAWLDELPLDFIWGQGRHRTFQRWISTLDDNTRARHPMLTIQLGRELLDIGRFEEAQAFIDLGLLYGESNPDPAVKYRAQLALAKADTYFGRPDSTLEICQSIVARPDVDLSIRRSALISYGSALVQFSRFSEARQAFLEALNLPEDNSSRPNALVRQNLASVVLIPLGDFVTAENILRANDEYFRHYPHGRYWHYLGWAALHESMGDWSALENDLAESRRSEAAAEIQDEADVWGLWYAAMRFIGVGQFEKAELQLDDLSRIASSSAEEQICLAYARIWLRRRQNRPGDVKRLADEALAQDWPVPFYRGLIALERAIACGETHPALSELVRVRSRHTLLRLRAWQAVNCADDNDRQREKYARQVICALDIPGYQSLLVTRDPELGVAFWGMCLVKNIEIDRTVDAFCKIGNVEAVAPLLKQDNPAVRTRAARALAGMGCEEGMPFLASALAKEEDPRVVKEIEASLDNLERQPPPILTIHLMGDFSLKRGDTIVRLAEWPRPIVRRLMQYFSLHQGEALNRDRILEDLWPDADPQSARASLKQVLSWLRKVIEPFVRSRATSRYITVSDDIYCFDPQHNTSRVDIFEFEALVRPVLGDFEDHDVLTLPPGLLEALNGWKPLLPDDAYESWTLEAREKLLNLYVEACLYTARALLGMDRLVDAEFWAAKAIDSAPWLEEAYQVLMRAQARQGNRTLALKTHANAVAALQRELNVGPSALTEWLAQRLNASLDI
jgi:ATP/maltotriose-dependent transcriptional regulator MalT/DNA-binding SARP family transcriptional activator